jgi:hypothetical protein
MKAAKHRSAWVWLAVAALTIAVAARAQSGMQNARAYTGPVLQFLAAHSADQAPAAHALNRRASRASRHGADTAAVAAMLPVFFIGLVSPLSLLSPQPLDSTGHPPADPALPASFQRPPPQLL